jgi:SAM-dependent methyltransferase
MIGRATAPLEPWPRRALVRVLRGSPDVGARQRWQALWPVLESLPATPLALLDAGCGAGAWTLEIAARRPGWRLVGIDRVPERTARADAAARRLRLSNVSFACTDFERFHPQRPFDVVLSVCAAHYLAADGRGAEVFGQFRDWLRPGGWLVALLPRHREGTPFVRWLPRPDGHVVFRPGELHALCTGAGLAIEQLRPAVGRPGALARQIGWSRESHPRLLGALYPIERSLAWLDAIRPPGGNEPAVFWILVARRSGS